VSLSIKAQPWLHHLYSLAGYLSVEFEGMKEEFFVNYERCMTERTRIFDGVVDLIASLVAQGIPWGVVTNKSSRFTDPLTSAMPLFQSAGAIVSGNTTPHAKPHPEPLFEAARRMSVDPSRCVYVGDDERDIVAGLAAGMGTVAATYGYLGIQTDISCWNAHLHIDSPLDLLKFLKSA
jgi:phosphoglycolate phosphatase